LNSGLRKIWSDCEAQGHAGDAMGKVEEIIEEYEKYAGKNGFKLNPEKNVVYGTISRLLENEKKYGERYCPCRVVTGNKEEDKKIICPCAYHKKEIEEQGHCHCFLFVR